MMTCPDTASLRTWLDEDPAQLEAHLAACADCRKTVRRLRDDAVLAGALLRPLAPPGTPTAAQTEAALARARASLPAAVGAAEAADSDTLPERRRGLRPPAAFVRRVAAAAVVSAIAVVVVGTPAGRDAAEAFLAQFRSERFAVVTVDPQQAHGALAALERLGTVEGLDSAAPRQVADVDAAARVAGFVAAAPDPSALPAGADRVPIVTAAPAGEVRVTFSRQRAPELPVRFDGATLVIDTPGIVLQQYRMRGDGALVVAESGQLTADVEGGPSLAELRDWLLDRPGLPAETVAQLRAIDDWRTTLPLPVPAGSVAWRDTTVAGRPGVVLGDESGLGGAVLWQADGRIRAVAGTAPVSQLRRLAAGLDG